MPNASARSKSGSREIPANTSMPSVTSSCTRNAASRGGGSIPAIRSRRLANASARRFSSASATATRPSSADLNEAALAQGLDLLLVHHPRPRAHEIIWLARLLGRRGEHLHVVEDTARMTDMPVIARIRAVDDGGNALAPIHDRHGMGQ